MGAEERAAKNARISAVAEYERIVGPTLKFNERDECPKRGVPKEHLGRLWCQGADQNASEDERKRAASKSECPVEREHLHVLCPRCKYSWNELCADDDRNRQIEVVS